MTRGAVAGHEHRVVLTGCSGSGKSTLLDELARRGILVQPEVGRAIVREEMASGGNAVPWADPVAFVEKAVVRALAQFEAAQESDCTIVFDRGVVDLVSYLEFVGKPVPERLASAMRASRYAQDVLVTPPWPELYVDDGERRKSFETAVGEYTVLMRWYAAEGYRPVEVPRGSVAARADFCLEWLSAR